MFDRYSEGEEEGEEGHAGEDKRAAAGGDGGGDGGEGGEGDEASLREERGTIGPAAAAAAAAEGAMSGREAGHSLAPPEDPPLLSDTSAEIRSPRSDLRDRDRDRLSARFHLGRRALFTGAR